ncbi:MAG: CHAD domain-containing protein [Solirubrobacterales bacterium]
MKARAVEGLDPAAPLRTNAVRIVGTRLAELRALAAPALRPEASQAQHDLRIAAKRLRYVLELAEPCFGPEAADARRFAKRLQTVLGDLHDCDAMLPSAADVASLQTLLRTRRELLFKEFTELWSGQAEATWLALERALAI